MGSSQFVRQIALEASRNIRLGEVRAKYEANRILLRDVPAIYRHWVSQDEGLTFLVEDQSTGERSAFATLASKRGNRAYVERTRARLSGFEELLESDVRIDPEAATSNTAFITLTLETAVWDLESAWLAIGREFNRFIAALQKEFGRTNFFRVFQAHKSGYPHVHVIATFKHGTLHTFLHKNKNGRTSIRCQEKDEIARCWPMGFVDVEIPASVREVRTHILRYIERGILQEDVKGVSEAEKGFRTFQERFMEVAGYQWFFRKRTFGISRDWSTRLKESARLDSRPMHNSNCKVTFLGIADWSECLKAVKPSPSPPISPFPLRIELETLPLGLHEVLHHDPPIEEWKSKRWSMSKNRENLLEWYKGGWH